MTEFHKEHLTALSKMLDAAETQYMDVCRQKQPTHILNEYRVNRDALVKAIRAIRGQARALEASRKRMKND